MRLIKGLQVLSIVLAFLSSVALMFPWSKITREWQIRQNNRNLNSLLRSLAKLDAQFSDHAKTAGRMTLYDDTKLFGYLAGQKVSAEILNRTHQIVRRSHYLCPYSLQKSDGLISEDRARRSHAEIERQIREFMETDNDSRLRKIAFMTLFFSASFAILAAINS